MVLKKDSKKGAKATPVAGRARDHAGGGGGGAQVMVLIGGGGRHAMPTHGGPVARAPSNDPHAHATHAPESHLAQLPPEIKITQVS
eukprot:CAMPEP_0182562266 /NCGR_PEP_ID=MMETSP1324-20130603/4640_1 /TAXON_ID=236786 /ORGANISM="Florenciella sp., Strain RCC1587" /LENGTH=85 /DNA_ID=CAMNT_0024775167 /DNA_START=46 /DNA_END=300 /DNA_ORIENTATION=+